MLIPALVLAFLGTLLLLVPLGAGAARYAPALRFFGVALLFVAVLLLLIWALDDDEVGDRHAALLAVGGVGAAGAGAEPRPRPVLLAFAVAAVPVVAAFVLLVLGETGVLESEPWIKAALTGAGALVGGLGAAWAQAQVTPSADPRDDAGRPLLPAPNAPPPSAATGTTYRGGD